MSIKNTISLTNLDRTTSKNPVIIPPNEFIIFDSVVHTDKVNMLYFKFMIPDKFKTAKPVLNSFAVYCKKEHLKN